MDALGKRLAEFFAGRDDVRLAILFGSRARGIAAGESDVDLAVLSSRRRLHELAREVSLATGHEADVVDLTNVGYPLLKRIIHEGIVVHEGQRGAAAAWRSRALTTLDLDRPWFERMRSAYLDRLASGRSHG